MVNKNKQNKQNKQLLALIGTMYYDDAWYCTECYTSTIISVLFRSKKKCCYSLSLALSVIWRCCNHTIVWPVTVNALICHAARKKHFVCSKGTFSLVQAKTKWDNGTGFCCFHSWGSQGIWILNVARLSRVKYLAATTITTTDNQWRRCRRS